MGPCKKRSFLCTQNLPRTLGYCSPTTPLTASHNAWAVPVLKRVDKHAALCSPNSGSDAFWQLFKKPVWGFFLVVFFFFSCVLFFLVETRYLRTAVAVLISIQDHRRLSCSEVRWPRRSSLQRPEINV